MKQSGRIKTTADLDSVNINLPQEQTDQSSPLEGIRYAQYGLFFLTLPFLVIALIVWVLCGLVRQQIGRANNLPGADMDGFSHLPYTIQTAIVLMIGIILLRLLIKGLSSLIEERIRALFPNKAHR